VAVRFGEQKQAMRQFLAWKSIDDESESLNLDAFQRNQAMAKRKETDDRCIAVWKQAKYAKNAIVKGGKLVQMEIDHVGREARSGHEKRNWPHRSLQ
jgi:hypothetical protein